MSKCELVLRMKSYNICNTMQITETIYKTTYLHINTVARSLLYSFA